MKNKQPNPLTTAPAIATATETNASAAEKPPPLNKESLQENLMDSLDVMQLLRICRGTLYNWRKKGIIACSKVGGRIYFEVSDVYQMLKEKKQRRWKTAA